MGDKSEQIAVGGQITCKVCGRRLAWYTVNQTEVLLHEDDRTPFCGSLLIKERSTTDG